MKGKDFSGITIYSGLDVHLNQWNASIYVENKHFKTFQQDSDPKILYNYLTKNFPNATYKSAYEAGYFGYSAHRTLCELGVENIVINPSDIPTTDKERKRKTDRVDSRKIGRSLVNGQLEGIYIPTEQQQADRSLVRYRICKCRKSITRIKQQIKSFLAQQGIRYNDLGVKSNWSRAFVRKIRKIEFTCENDGFIRDELVDKYEYLLNRRRIVDRRIVMLSRQDRYKEIVTRLRTIPGVGLLTAMVLVTEVINMERFSSLDKLCSFFGIVPDTEQSDEMQKVKGLTKRVNKDVRRILIQASWVAAGKAPDIAVRYHNWVKNKRMLPQKAIVKVAKKLLLISRSMWLNQANYQSQL